MVVAIMKGYIIFVIILMLLYIARHRENQYWSCGIQQNVRKGWKQEP